MRSFYLATVGVTLLGLVGCSQDTSPPNRRSNVDNPEMSTTIRGQGGADAEGDMVADPSPGSQNTTRQANKNASGSGELFGDTPAAQSPLGNGPGTSTEELKAGGTNAGGNNRATVNEGDPNGPSIGNPTGSDASSGATTPTAQPDAGPSALPQSEQP